MSQSQKHKRPVSPLGSEDRRRHRRRRLHGCARDRASSRRPSPGRRRKSAWPGRRSRPAIRRSASASPRASTPSTISTSSCSIRAPAGRRSFRRSRPARPTPAPGLIGDWLKPLEQGFDVKLFVGSHGGCQRLLASKASGITDLAGVKGKTIATYGIGAPPQVAFQVTLAKAGIDPETDVTWKAVPFDLVGETVNRGDADLAAHLDPWAWSIEKQFGFTKIADTQTGVYENHTCCVLGANGPFLQANKDALRRLAEANIEVHEYTANHPDEVAKWYFDDLKPAGLEPAGSDRNPRQARLSQPSDRAGADRPNPGGRRGPEARQGSRSDDRSEGVRRTHHGQPAGLKSSAMSQAIRTLDGRFPASRRKPARGVLVDDLEARVARGREPGRRRPSITIGLPDVVPWGSARLFAAITGGRAVAVPGAGFSVVHARPLRRARRSLRSLVHRHRRLARAVGTDDGEVRLAAKAVLLAAARAAERLRDRRAAAADLHRLHAAAVGPWLLQRHRRRLRRSASRSAGRSDSLIGACRS